MSMIGNFRLATPQQIDELVEEPQLIHRFLDDPEAEELHWSVDQAWDGIHFLLTRQTQHRSPHLWFIKTGGREIEEEVGYDVPRAFDARELQAIVKALEPITREVLRGAYDLKAMASAQVHAAAADRPDEADAHFDYLAGHFEELKSFLASAPPKGLGLIVWID
ncbi:MAG: YfbM family protein [Myxococcales bacterium]